MKKNLNKRLLIWAAIVAGILMIPFITKAPWTQGDYIFAGLVLFGSAAGYEVTASILKNRTQRLVAAAVAIGAVIFVWFLAVSGP